MKLRIFSDQNYVVPGAGHVTMLYPYWGKNREDPDDPSSGRYDRYLEKGAAFFEMTSLADADFAVLPMPWECIHQDPRAQDLSGQFLRRVQEAGKPVIVFFWSDSEAAVPVDNAIIFRTSLTRTRRQAQEFAMPAWNEDIVAQYGQGTRAVREKRLKPRIGFCGFGRINWTLKNMLYRGASLVGLKDRGAFAGHRLRAQALRVLSHSSLVEANFIIREAFLGGALHRDGRIDYPSIRRLRQEFIQNMIESDYIFCSRGNGNFSYRLYETLCCGRIPVFVDTDCVLPYDFAIDWKKYCVWVESRELAAIAEKVADFHHHLSPGDFEELQHDCRKLWEDWLSPEGFFQNFHRHFPGGRNG